MQLTRRSFLASFAVCALSACSSGGGATSESGEWHTILVEGLQLSVPSDAEMDPDDTQSSPNYSTHRIEGTDIDVLVEVALNGGEVTGSYDIREVNGLTVYTKELSDDATEAMISHDGKLYDIMLYAKDTEDRSAYETARDHLIESLRF